MAIVPHTIPGGIGTPARIFAETENINFFVGGVLEPDEDSGPTNIQVQFSGSSRQQYPGDPTPVTTGGGSRVVLVDPSRKTGNAIPGKNFILTSIDEDGDLIEKRQFSYTGTWVKVHAFLRANCTGNVFAYNSSGARYTISTAAPA